MRTDGDRVKLIFLLKGRADLDRQAVMDYYETHHVPLILSLFPTIGSYRRNFVAAQGRYRAPNAAELDFDIVTEIEFETVQDYQQMASQMRDATVTATIAADEANFLDSTYTRMIKVDCHETARTP
jgi:hypothetical protein